MKSSENTFASLIAIEGNQWHYHIPRFQREYVWRKNNWAKLIEDIYENDSGHYMGSVICVQDNIELTPNTELIYEVVDGQQRLTTISLLLCAIYKKLNLLAKDNASLSENEDLFLLRNSIKKRLIKQVDLNLQNKMPWAVYKSGINGYCLRVQPSTQSLNLADYQEVLKDAGVITEGNFHKWFGNRIIYKAYDYFYKRIPSDLKGLSDLIARVYAMSFIHIVESSQSKAFMLFETLNYRGVPLSAIDIIKNKMLATLERKHAISINDAYNQWQILIKNLPEDRDQDRFLRQFYNAYKFDEKIKVENITRATGSSIIAIYETLIKKDAQFILPELIEKSKIYNQLIEAEKYPENDFSESLLDLELIGAAPSYTFLLYLFSLPTEKFVEVNIKDKVVKLLCKYYYRRNVTDFPFTRDLDTINIDLVEKCQQEIREKGKLSFPFIQTLILSGRGKPAPLSSFKDALSDNLFYNNDYMARYALTKLDESSHNREYAPNLWQRNEKGLFVWTVEHVFPQGENIPSEWVSMMANGIKDDAEKIQGEWVHCLGNLTLSGYNSRLSNLSFDKKQARADVNVFGDSIAIGYKNGLALNQIKFVVNGQETSLASAEKWDLDHIKARNDVLVEMVIKLFKFDDEELPLR